MKVMVRVVFGVLLLICCAQLSGCMFLLLSAVDDAAVKNYPTYAQTASTWPEIPEGNGRVLILFPPPPMKEVQAVFTPIPITFRPFSIDDTLEGVVNYKTFVFVDLKPGKHWIKYGAKWGMSGEQILEFDLSSGETKYLRIVEKTIGLAPPQELSEEEAQTLLKDMHHLFKEPVPFDKSKLQKKS